MVHPSRSASNCWLCLSFRFSDKSLQVSVEGWLSTGRLLIRPSNEMLTCVESTFFFLIRLMAGALSGLPADVTDISTAAIFDDGWGFYLRDSLGGAYRDAHRGALVGDVTVQVDGWLSALDRIDRVNSALMSSSLRNNVSLPPLPSPFPLSCGSVGACWLNFSPELDASRADCCLNGIVHFLRVEYTPDKTNCQTGIDLIQIQNHVIKMAL